MTRTCLAAAVIALVATASARAAEPNGHLVATYNYTQYKSVSHAHASDKATWSHAGTNGFRSTMEAGSR
jgi:hypothetical protein